MNISQIENNIQSIFENFNKETFIYDFLLSFGTPKATIKKLEIGTLNLSKTEGEIIWKKKLFFRVEINQDLHSFIDEIKRNDAILKHEPRFIIVTDYKTLLAYDRKTNESLDIAFEELPKHFSFFLPLAGMEKSQNQFENPADVKAAERMAKLYDEIKKDNIVETKEDVHNLNVFLSRLLFCFFAEDTGIFEQGLFTNAIKSHTQQDGSDLNTYLDKLFEVMNTPHNERKNLPTYLSDFDYVNGGLFRNSHNAPLFTSRSRQMVIECGTLDWASINPDIFGSMIQAVVTPEHRGGMGMHYTSVPNIMKLIEPLFLNDLNEIFEESKGNIKKLNDLLKRIWNIKIFDPACGSGNFLIISYKELRKLEMKIFKEIDNINGTYSQQYSGISLNHFYGIELDDFAHEVAILSLWLAEHQMNQEFFKAFGRTKAALPLEETGNIVQGNACRLDWEVVCPKNECDEIYIIGNPPFLGSSLQILSQKKDMEIVFKGIENFKNLDYISSWFFKASNFISSTISKFAFVSTNSICQGEQVQMLWPLIFVKKLEIDFCTNSFKWENNAKNKAAVNCVIIGLRNISNKEKKYYKNDFKISVRNINPYLVPSESNSIINKRNKPLSNFPIMTYGNKPTDGGFLLLTDEEKKILPETANKFLKKIIGAKEFMDGISRWCLWIDEKTIDEAIQIDEIARRIELVRLMRLNSSKKATQKLADKPYKFGEIRHQNCNSIIVPRHGSEKREFLPFGYVNNTTVVSDSAQTIYSNDQWIFSVISSKIHYAWIKSSCGKIKEDPRYSSSFGYNTFPFPKISENQKLELEQSTFRILDERQNYSELTLAQMYDPNKMPEGLREAHRQNDLAVERCYRSKPFENDEERLEYLFKLYEQMVAEEQEQNTLFAKDKKLKKK
jgi:hypothetical protein